MVLPRRLWIGLAVVGAAMSALCAPAEAQARAAADTASSAKIPTDSLPVLSPDAVSGADAALLNARQADVSQAASFYGFDLASTDWKYQQVLCADFPRELILAFTNANSPRGASHFTAIIPRAGGRVQVVTGYSHGLRPFKPSWNSPGSIAVFNRMLEAERGTGAAGLGAIRGSDHWLELGMCYAALTGPPPEAALETEDVATSEHLARLGAATPVIRIGDRGAADVAFSDVREPDRAYNWTLSFDGNGKLKSADRAEARPATVTHQGILPPAPIVAR